MEKTYSHKLQNKFINSSYCEESQNSSKPLVTTEPNIQNWECISKEDSEESEESIEDYSFQNAVMTQDLTRNINRNDSKSLDASQIQNSLAKVHVE